MVGRDLQNTNGTARAMGPGNVDSYAFIGVQRGPQFAIATA
jgi:hypothetical protein